MCQLAILGTTFENNSGWRQEIIGKDFPRTTLERFFHARNVKFSRAEIERARASVRYNRTKHKQDCENAIRAIDDFLEWFADFKTKDLDERFQFLVSD